MSFSLAIALAWPETYCKKAGAWYDKPANFFGVAKDHYYKVGHSAVILIQPGTCKCLYFDFGRYHAPEGYGRVRDESTDHELVINTRAEITEYQKLNNFQQIIDEVQSNKACHGQGQLYAGFTRIDFKKAFKIAKDAQNQGIIHYGPFTPKGTNCSRFVRKVLFHATLSLLLKLRLTFPWTISPTPIGIIRNLKIRKKANLEISNPEKQNNSISKFINSTLPQPKRPENIPESAQWLAGEGAGSWFYIKNVSNENEFEIQRFSPDGFMECKGIFEARNKHSILELNKSFKFVHLSHCAFMHIQQGNKIIKLIRKVS